MGYFAENYKHLRWPIAEGAEPGFRPAQSGALHAIGAHFPQDARPGIITMPTGSGKTVVLVAAPFLLRSQRVLVLTPSRLVREQIADEFGSLGALRARGI